MDPNEKVLLEAIGNMLQQKAKLGLAAHDPEETSHATQFEWEGLDDMFNIKTQDLTFHDAITSAFQMVHSYKYIDDPRFNMAFEKELEARAVPPEEIAKSIDVIQTMRDGLKDGNERSHGWNQDMEGLIDVTTNADDRKMNTSEPFTGGGPAPK
jgi:hypothetical protein